MRGMTEPAPWGRCTVRLWIKDKGGGGVAGSHGVGLLAFGGASWPLSIVQSDPLRVRGEGGGGANEGALSEGAGRLLGRPPCATPPPPPRATGLHPIEGI